jgi:DNA modification methylase
MLTGDCRELLSTLPDSSVQCCVTSPPYFGLRDYGTASWDGGDAACDHVERVLKPSQRSTLEDHGPDGRSPQLDALPGIPYRNACRKCGATRVDQQIGLEPTVDVYVAEMVAVFRAVRRVLRDDGVLFLNLGDSYNANQGKGFDTNRDGGSRKAAAASPRVNSGLAVKQLLGMPWRVAFALQQPWLTCRECGTEHHLSQWASFPNGRRICPACEMSKGHDISESGWYLRSDIIWAKPNPMPESVRDRPTKAHEYIFLLTKSPRYFWDVEAVKEPLTYDDPRQREDYVEKRIRNRGGRTDGFTSGSGTLKASGNGRNIRSVWTIATAPFSAAHFATFPPALAERCIKAGTSENGACSACGAPWVRVVALLEPTQNGGGGQPARNAEYGRPGVGGCTLPSSGRAGEAAARETIGWQPTCTCDAPIVPCVVLDPFGGAGTVSLVAERLGRDSIYIDLSESYAAMARNRIYDDAPMFTEIGT